jgi:hypothetical protein
MVGLYETALEELAVIGKVRPKIVASTATVRRADSQIHALFCRSSVEIFPPPGPDRRDSFFARTLQVNDEDPRTNGRLYVGIAAQGAALRWRCCACTSHYSVRARNGTSGCVAAAKTL